MFLYSFEKPGLIQTPNFDPEKFVRYPEHMSSEISIHVPRDHYMKMETINMDIKCTVNTKHVLVIDNEIDEKGTTRVSRKSDWIEVKF